MVSLPGAQGSPGSVCTKQQNYKISEAKASGIERRSRQIYNYRNFSIPLSTTGRNQIENQQGYRKFYNTINENVPLMERSTQQQQNSHSFQEP